jgi:methylated-DNA-[protein]-cysteine S-methyltransferase
MIAPSKPPEPQPYCLFETAIGTCGVAWNERGLTRLQLPEPDRNATEQRLGAGRPGAGRENPPPRINQAIAAIQRYLAGENVDFCSVAVDLPDASRFHRTVYAATRAVGWGHTASYGELARKAGSPGAARAVGRAMSRNPIPLIIPCHRMLAGGRKIGGFSAYGATSTKRRLLALEGIRLDGDAPLLPGL